MNSQKSQLENISEEQKEMIKGFDDETLTRIYQNRETALNYAKRGIHKTESRKSPEEIADFMQILARIAWKKEGS